jgi:hypothetical protein
LTPQWEGVYFILEMGSPVPWWNLPYSEPASEQLLLLFARVLFLKLIN